jgi:hypothetical protein
MGRKAIPYERVRVNVWIIKSQNDELKRVSNIIGKNMTDTINEALAYWLATQRKMGVK